MASSEDLQNSRDTLLDLTKKQKTQETLISWRSKLVNGTASVNSVLLIDLSMSPTNQVLTLSESRGSLDAEDLKPSVINSMQVKIDALQVEIDDLKDQLSGEIQ